MKIHCLFVLSALLLLFGGRASAFYNPSTGRWLSKDPLGEVGFEIARATAGTNNQEKPEAPSANTYAFVFNQPISNYDALGLQAALPPGWHGPGQDYDPSSNPFAGQGPPCITRCVAEHILGIEVETTAIIAGQPLLTKRFITPGSAQGTSIAGKLTDAILADAKLPVRVPTLSGGWKCCRIAYTRSASRAVSRYVPVVGWVFLTYDAAGLAGCICGCAGL